MPLPVQKQFIKPNGAKAPYKIMLKISTKDQIMQHYMDAGMPEVYAFIAAQETKINFIDENANKTLLGAFIWEKSTLGFEFWDAISRELDNG